MPTSAQSTYSNAKLEPAVDPGRARTINMRLKPSTTYQQGSVLGEVTATPGLAGAYASGNGAGTQNPRFILPYACQTDGSGNITLTGTSGAVAPFGQTSQTIDVYHKGIFATADLPASGVGAIDATAVTAGQGSLQLHQGTLTKGLVEIL